MFDTLSYKKVSIIAEQYKTSGHSPLKVIANDFTPYVMKFRKNEYDSSSIVKEFLCHYLLKCWDIPTPNISALSVPDDLLDTIDFIKVREKRLIKNSTCFGSELIQNVIEINELFELRNIGVQSKIININDILKIALFDIWVENEDRKSTNPNLLLDISGKNLIFKAIDHAYTFSSIEFKELSYDKSNFSYNDSILFASFAKSIINKNQIDNKFGAKYEDLFYLCIGNVKNHLNQIIEIIPDNLLFTDNDRTFLSNFLFNNKRNKCVFHQFLSIINQLKK